jgi:hypothetical protein
LWFGEFDEKRASIRELVELFKAGRNNPHAFMNWQSKEQDHFIQLSRLRAGKRDLVDL